MLRLPSLLICISAAAWAPGQGLTKDLYKMEMAYRENVLQADSSLKGKTVSFNTFVQTVDKKNGKPVILVGIIYNDGTEVYGEIFLTQDAVATAMKLKPNDQIKVTGILKKREVRSKDTLRINGYIGGSYNGNGGGGSVNGGTVTLSWPVYTVDKATVSIVQTEAKRQQVAAQEEAARQKKQGAIDEAWKEAVGKLDTKAAQKAFDLGLDNSAVDSVLEEINRLDPDLPFYPQAIDFYVFLIKSGKGNNANAIARSIGMDPTMPGGYGFGLGRPKLFKALVDMKAVNMGFKFENGDTFLHYLIKDPTSRGIRSDSAAKNLKLTFTETDLAMVEALLSSPEAKGIADVPDKYGKSAKDYVKEANTLITFGSQKEVFTKIKELIEKAP